MNAINTLESIADLLPPDRRERFLRMVATFRTVPEDDEFLQILEAIGFMTLLWKEVPQEIRGVLEGANPITETCESVAIKVREAVIESIPSYEDLKQISQRLESHDLTLARLLSKDTSSHIGSAKQTQSRWSWLTFTAGLVLGILGSIFASPSFIFFQ